METIIVAATGSNWTPTGGTVKDQTDCTLAFVRNGHEVSLYFYAVQIDSGGLATLRNDHRVFGVITPSALGAASPGGGLSRANL